MRIISKEPLRDFWESYPDSKHPLLSWHKVVEKADWDSPQELKAQYQNASILKNGRAVFNIAGNKYRLIVQINYKRKMLFIKFIGTHKEYDNVDADTVDWTIT